ncbi:MAG: folylpolyglutamate synthase/dihydrofolate synthase family protein [Pseudomonadota bacterium]
MPDHATSTSPAVQAQLDRLVTLSPGADVLGLSRITELLDRLGNPHLRLPPVFHVAGTNGKGSTCAFLRAALEADGYRVHAYTSPHLVRFNERIRIAGRLIEDDALAHLLDRVLAVAEGIGASFFEVTTAAAFLIFAETPADACIIEVGLGGRLDATNVLVDPAACGIAQLGIDHEAFLGSSATGIAREKAGIAKAGRPLVTLAYPPDIAAAVAEVANAAGARLLMEGRDWSFTTDDGLRYRDAAGLVAAPSPGLTGAHQYGNLALAAAMLRHQDRISISPDAIAHAATAARWPARMQRLGVGPLTALLPPGIPLWLDGGHNPAAAGAVADTLGRLLHGRKADLIVAMLANKDAAGFLAPFAPHAASLTAVPIPGHDHHAPAALAAIGRDLAIESTTATDVRAVLSSLAERGTRAVAILGSLYLAGEVLAANDQWPD